MNLIAWDKEREDPRWCIQFLVTRPEKQRLNPSPKHCFSPSKEVKMKCVLAFLSVVVPLSLGQSCPDGWVHSLSSCYQVSATDNLNFYGAQQYCAELGGFLAEITSEDEQVLSGRMPRSCWNTTTNNNSSNNNRISNIYGGR